MVRVGEVEEARGRHNGGRVDHAIPESTALRQGRDA